MKVDLGFLEGVVVVGERVDVDVPPLRLTRRGRVVAVAVLGVTALAVVLGVVQRGAFADAPSGNGPVVVVKSGDSVESILRAHVPHRANGEGVSAVIQENQLDGARIYPGQELELPS